jgi:hypothetical protein
MQDRGGVYHRSGADLAYRLCSTPDGLNTTGGVSLEWSSRAITTTLAESLRTVCLRSVRSIRAWEQTQTRVLVWKAWKGTGDHQIALKPVDGAI